MPESSDDSLARQLERIDRRAEERHRRLLADSEERHQELIAQQRELRERSREQHRQLIERGAKSERIFIDALVEIDASMKRSNERSAAITASIHDMRESIRANTQAVLSVLDRLGPAPGA